MSSHIEQTIAEFVADIDRMEKEAAETKRLVNRLCQKASQPARYAEREAASAPTLGSIRRDQWYGQAISGAIREYLSMRRAANIGPATVAEIFDALRGGGFEFGTDDAENAKRNLRICLTKNSGIFHRLPDGRTYGLLDWYPEAKTRRERNPRQSTESDVVAEDVAEEADTNGDSEVVETAQ